MRIHWKSLLKPYKLMKRSGINFKCPEYYLVHINTHYVGKPDHFSLNCFTWSKFRQVFYWLWRFYLPHKKPWHHYVIWQYFYFPLPLQHKINIYYLYDIQDFNEQLEEVCAFPLYTYSTFLCGVYIITVFVAAVSRVNEVAHSTANWI